MGTTKAMLATSLMAKFLHKAVRNFAEHFSGNLISWAQQRITWNAIKSRIKEFYCIFLSQQTTRTGSIQRPTGDRAWPFISSWSHYRLYQNDSHLKLRRCFYFSQWKQTITNRLLSWQLLSFWTKICLSFFLFLIPPVAT